MRIKFEDEEHGPLTIWEKPIAGAQYVGFIDAASGMRGTSDYSVIKIMECQYMREAACWRSNSTPIDKVASTAMCLGYHYNVALLGAETEKWGAFANYYMSKHEYPSLYVRVRYGRVNNTGQRTTLGTELGWRTDARTRDLMFGVGMNVVNDRVCQINSLNQLDEMRELYRGEDGKPHHPKTGNDDEVMAWLGCLMLRDACYSRRIIVNQPLPPTTDAQKEEAWVAGLVKEMDDGQGLDKDIAWTWE